MQSGFKKNFEMFFAFFVIFSELAKYTKQRKYISKIDHLPQIIVGCQFHNLPPVEEAGREV